MDKELEVRLNDLYIVMSRAIKDKDSETKTSVVIKEDYTDSILTEALRVAQAWERIKNA